MKTFSSSVVFALAIFSSATITLAAPRSEKAEIKTLAERHSGNPCSGSSQCKGRNLGGDCAGARVELDEAANYTSTSDKSGTCSGACGVFVEGNNPWDPPCTLTGKQMKDAFDYIRSENCGECGWNEVTPGCYTTINYVDKCDDGSNDLTASPQDIPVPPIKE